MNTTTFYLIRHATNDLVGNSIAGWAPGIHLNEQGRREAALLPERLAGIPINRIYSSPLERAQETAAPLASQLGLPIRPAQAIGEVQFGAWTGRRFSDLESDPQWQGWNRIRSLYRTPGGEAMLDVQSRYLRFVQEVCGDCPNAGIALFSHGDPIRAALMYWLGMPIDFVHRLEISPTSVSIVELSDISVRVLTINRT